MQPPIANAANSQEQQLRAQVELLKSPDATSSASPPAESRASEPPSHTSESPPPQSRHSNGYDPSTIASHDVARAIAAKGHGDAHIHPDLRGAQNYQQPPQQGYRQPPNANMLPIAPPSGPSPGPSGHAQLAPAPPSADVSMDQGQEPMDGRSRAKRELSQSKRAAQNRAAQRAFRQRKEGYIKKLEQQVRDYASMEQAFKKLQAETYAMREYVIILQSRLLGSEGEFPSPPDNVNLAHPSSNGHGQSSETSTVNAGCGTPLEAVAQAVAGLAAHEQLNERFQQQQALRKDQKTPANDLRPIEGTNKQPQPGEESFERAVAA